MLVDYGKTADNPETESEITSLTEETTTSASAEKITTTTLDETSNGESFDTTPVEIVPETMQGTMSKAADKPSSVVSTQPSATSASPSEPPAAVFSARSYYD
ncbi:MAG: hypothetical protein LBJ12_06670 [Oscillospiraceae bacterium]|nr:hypothetical protein [Oscillospiraceae bacterium]